MGSAFQRDLPLPKFHHVYIVSTANKESNLERKYLDYIASSSVSSVIFKYFLTFWHYKMIQVHCVDFLI